MTLNSKILNRIVEKQFQKEFFDLVESFFFIIYRKYNMKSKFPKLLTLSMRYLYEISRDI